MMKTETAKDFEMKLVYYVGDSVIKEEDVTADNIEDAVNEVAIQDYDQLGLDLEESEYGYEDCLIGIRMGSKGWLVWQNSDGDRGYDFDVNELDVDPRIKQAVNSMD